MPALVNFLTGNWMPLAIVAKLAWLIQIGLLIHAIRTGRPFWWFWILLSFPVLGGLVYVWVEMLPEWRPPPGGGFLAALRPHAWRLRDLEAQLDESDTVTTRLALASALLAAGRKQEADEVATESLHGVFRDDPHTLAAVARFKVELGRWNEALAMLDQVNTAADRMLAIQVCLLKGRAFFGAGQLTAAETCLRSLDGRFIGEEPRYYLALILEATGRHAEAMAIWEDILKRFRRASPAWRRTERPWYRLAKAHWAVSRRSAG